VEVAGVDLASIGTVNVDIEVANPLVSWLHAVCISINKITKMNFFIFPSKISVIAELILYRLGKNNRVIILYI
jgi:hypothetical protein